MRAHSGSVLERWSNTNDSGSNPVRTCNYSVRQMCSNSNIGMRLKMERHGIIEARASTGIALKGSSNLALASVPTHPKTRSM